MTNLIQIKYSEVTSTPPSLARGEQAYSELSHSLFIGTAAGGVTKIGGAADVTKLAGIEAGAQVNIGTDLFSRFMSADLFEIGSSTGDAVTIPLSSGTQAGLMSVAHAAKLSGIATGAQVNVATNLSSSKTSLNMTVKSSTGSDTTLDAVTQSTAGVMIAVDKAKIDGIEAGAQVNIGTDLSSRFMSANVFEIVSNTGSAVTIPLSSGTQAGLMSVAHDNKLAGIATGAQVNVATNLGVSTATTTVAVTSSTGNNTTIPAVTTSKAGVMTNAMLTKLNGIETSADVNALIASQGDAEAGSNNTKTMTPLRVAQAISAMANTIKNNFTATTNPTSSDDSADGYVVGSVWVNINADDAFRCVGAELGSAVWIKTSLEASDLHTVATSGMAADLTQDSTHRMVTDTERTKLAGIAAGAQVNVGTDLSSRFMSADVFEIVSSTGDAIGIPLSSGTQTGLMSVAQDNKLAGIATGANKFVHPTGLSATTGLNNNQVISSVVSVGGHVTNISKRTLTPAHIGAMAVGVAIDGGSF